MVKSSKAFNTTRNAAKVAYLIINAGAGVSQLVLVPSLGDPLGMVEEQLMTASQAFYEQTHDV